MCDFVYYWSLCAECQLCDGEQRDSAYYGTCMAGDDGCRASGNVSVRWLVAWVWSIWSVLWRDKDDSRYKNDSYHQSEDYSCDAHDSREQDTSPVSVQEVWRLRRRMLSSPFLSACNINTMLQASLLLTALAVYSYSPGLLTQREIEFV